jgi:magnesium chelatase family protein
MENGRILIARAARRVEFPARFQLVAAMNPCPCGYQGHPSRECRCTPDQVARYQGRLSGPFLDRLDLLVEVPALPPQVLAAAPDGEPSAVVAARVARARELALARQGCCNARLEGAALDQQARPEPAALALLQRSAEHLAWSARAYHRVLRVARSVADLAGSPGIELAAMAEAVQLRRGLRP